MLKQLIDYFIEVSLRHKAVYNARYKNKIYTNAQGNNGYFQMIFNTDPYFQLLVSSPNTPFTLTVNIDILGHPKSDFTVLDCQDAALTIGVQFLAFIANDSSWYSNVVVHDYSFLALDEYTDDRSAGQRLTLELIVPNPLDICTYLDEFDDEPKPIDVEDKEIDLIDVNPPSQADELELHPILIPYKKK